MLLPQEKELRILKTLAMVSLKTKREKKGQTSIKELFRP
jgi:hypothetical protein